jgi:cell division septal protein FtsQ
MKKLLVAFVLIMAVLVVNAQATTTPVVKEKPVRAVVMVGDLQKTITDNIAKDYVGYTIKEAFSLTTNSIVEYEVVIVKGTSTEKLLYDKNGVFIKKLPTPPPAPKK